MTRSTEHRMRIYALMSDYAALRPTSQDQIDEAQFLATLSTFADVYYNGQRFQPEVEGWGLDATTINPPDGGYDLYYVNDNPPVFLNCPSPRIARAVPYDAGVFHAADAVLTSSGIWKEALQSMAAGTPPTSQLAFWYRDLAGPLPAVLDIPPSIDVTSRWAPAQREVTAARAVMSYGKLVGYFGPARAPVLPAILLAAYREARHFAPELQFVFGGGLEVERPKDVIVTPPTAFGMLPAYVKACFAVAADEGPNTNLVASSRISEALSACVPIIALRTEAHVELLGASYPLFYTDRESAAKRLLELFFDRGLGIEVREYMSNRAAALAPQVAGARLKDDFETLIRAASIMSR